MSETALPDGWVHKPLGEVSKPGYGKALDSSLRKSAGRFPVVGSAGVMAFTDSPLVGPGTLVVGRKGNIGQVQLLEDGGWPIDTVYFLKVPLDVNSKYLALVLESLELRRFNSSTTTPSLRREDLEAVLVPICTITEQERIVEILEEQLSRLDAAVKSVQTVREKAAQFRRALLHAVFDGSRPQPGDGEDWVDITIGQACRVVAGRTPSKFEERLAARPDSDRSIPFYKVGDMNTSERFISSARVHFSPDESEIFGMQILPRGTVVFPKAGGAIATNKKRVVELPGAIDLNCMAVIPDEEIDSRLVYWFLQSINLSSLADGSVLPQIGKRRVEAVNLSVPKELAEQARLVDFLEDRMFSLGLIESACERALVRSYALRRSLLHAAFTGELTRSWRESHV